MSSKEATIIEQGPQAVQYRFNIEDDYFSPLDEPVQINQVEPKVEENVESKGEESSNKSELDSNDITAESEASNFSGDTIANTQPTDNLNSDVDVKLEDVKDADEGSKQNEQFDNTSDDISDTVKEVTDNFYKVKAFEMIQKGELPEDFDIENQELNANTIFTAWEDNIKPQVYQSLQNQFLQELNNAGYTAEHLQMAKMLYNNADYNELSDALDYKDLSDQDISSFDDSDKIEYIKLAYQDRGLEDFAISKMIDSAEVDGDIDKLLETSQKHYKDRYNELYQTQIQRAAQEEENRKQLELQKLNTLNSIIQNKEIKGEKLTNDQAIQFKNALTNATVPIDHNGQRYNFTPFQVFTQALQTNYELQLYAFKKYLFKDQEGQAMIKELQKKAEDDALLAWGEVKDVKKDTKSKITKKEKTNASSDVIKFTTDGGFELYEKK